MVTAFFVSLTLARLKARESNINPDVISNLSFLVFISGIIGARIFYVAENLGYYLRQPLQIIMLQHGGLSWYGGLIAGVVLAIVYIKNKALSVYRIFDLISPFVALGQAIGRIGCLLNGCCYGKVSSYGIYFNVYRSVLIPTQIYSSLMLLIIFLILRFMQEKSHTQGVIFYTYILTYSFKRFLIEFWRAEHMALIWGLNLFQIISLFMFVLGVLGLLFVKNKA
ncbi:MAG: prolipoprotein diacylglyceryl transferase [Candidatus Omnitrophica bacterium]|nr:prolipoprotein diacylglyceryl transferase [Candidatus Omnitrophota bacterium]